MTSLEIRPTVVTNSQGDRWMQATAFHVQTAVGRRNTDTFRCRSPFYRNSSSIFDQSILKTPQSEKKWALFARRAEAWRTRPVGGSST